MAGVCLSSHSRTESLCSTDFDFLSDGWGIPGQDVHQNEYFWRIGRMMPSGRRHNKYCLDFKLQNPTKPAVTSKLQENEQFAHEYLISQGHPCNGAYKENNCIFRNNVEKDAQSAEQNFQGSCLGIQEGVHVFHSLEDRNEKASDCSKIFGKLASVKQHGVEPCLESEEIRKAHWDSCTKDHNDKHHAWREDSLSQQVKIESQNATMRDEVHVHDDSSSFSTKSKEFSCFSSTADEFRSSQDEYSSCNEVVRMKKETACSRQNRNFPPPLTTDTIYTTLSDLPIPMPKVHLQSIKSSGRFILKETSSRPQLLLKAQRKNGRLQVRLVRHDSAHSIATDHEETETRRRRMEVSLLQTDKNAQCEQQTIPKFPKESQTSKEIENLPNEEHQNEARLQREGFVPETNSISWQNGDDGKQQGSEIKANSEDTSKADLANPKELIDNVACIQSNTEDAFPSLWALIAEPWSYCPARVQLKKDAPAYLF
eukprot:c16800_g1_i1 orf=390-1838(+)